MRFQSTCRDGDVLRPDEVLHLEERLARRCPTLPVVLLYLHGAHARGTQSKLSDLDLAVLLERGVVRDREKRRQLCGALDEACQRDDVDVVFLNTAGPIIKDRVVRTGRLVFARSDLDRVRFEAAAIKESLDFRYFSEKYDRALFRQLREGRFLGRQGDYRHETQ